MRTILLVKTSSLGDVIHNLPVASDLRARFPEAVIDWVVETPFSVIPRMHPAVNNIIPVSIRQWRRALWAADTWREMATFKRLLQRQSYDCILDTQGLIKSAIIAGMARGKRYGFAAEAAREPLAARFYQNIFAIPKGIHAVERNRWLAAAALGYKLDLPLDYGIQAPGFSAPWLPNKAYVVCLTATSRADKLWANENWISIGHTLAERGLHCVFPAGTPAERTRAESIAAELPLAVVAPRLAIAELAGLISGAQSIVGVDTGLTHLAAALGKPVVAIYCATDPALTGAHAATPVRNLGTTGSPPSPEEVMTVLEEFEA